jgi:general secretion pathway protein D
MKPTLSPAALALAISLALGTLGASTTQAQSRRTPEPVTLNFVGADIEAVARTMATITGRNVVVDPRVKGTINLLDRPAGGADGGAQPVCRRAAPAGLSLVETGGLYKIVPEADAKLQSNTVSAGPVASCPRATRSSRRSSASTTNRPTTWCRCCAR